MTETDERRPPAQRNGAHVTTSSPATIPAAGDIAALLELSRERDLGLRRVLRHGACEFRRGQASMSGQYDLGFADGILAYKHAQHDAFRSAQLEAERWGPRGRGHFADPRPGDFPGLGTWPPPAPSVIWLGGPPVHRHSCVAACYAYAPGPYTPEAAAAILATLPGGGA